MFDNIERTTRPFLMLWDICVSRLIDNVWFVRFAFRAECSLLRLCVFDVKFPNMSSQDFQFPFFISAGCPSKMAVRIVLGAILSRAESTKNDSRWYRMLAMTIFLNLMGNFLLLRFTVSILGRIPLTPYHTSDRSSRGKMGIPQTDRFFGDFDMQIFPRNKGPWMNNSKHRCRFAKVNIRHQPIREMGLCVCT